MQIVRAVLVSLLVSGLVASESRDAAAQTASELDIPGENPHSGQLRYDLLHAPRETQIGPSSGMAPARNPAVAFGLSALLPGAGQAYNRQWVKAAAGIAVEAALVTGYVVLRNRGLEEEAEFQAFAHQAWDPAQYAGWLNDYRSYLQEQIGVSITAPPVDVPNGVDFSRPDSWSSTERQDVAVMITQIRAIERQAIHPETGAAFSHQLPGFGEQQYYELIGKYFQFAPGWEDYPDWVAEDGSFTSAIDPERTGPNGEKPNVSETFFRYAKDHGDAQDVLRTASRMSVLFIVNHLIAGIDAAVTAKMRNDKLTAERVSTRLGFAYTPSGMPAPTAAVSIRF